MRKLWIKSGAVALIMMMAMFFAACGGDEIFNHTHNNFPQAPAFDPYREYDVIVVGTGITGFASFFALKELGPQIVGRNLDVLFIEQEPITGGLSNTAGGIFNNANMLWAGHPGAPAANAANTGTRTLFEAWHYGQMRGMDGAVYAATTHQNHTASTVRRVNGVPLFPYMDKLWNAAHNALPSRQLMEGIGIQIAPGSGRVVMQRMTETARARYGIDAITLNARAVGLLTVPLLGPYGRGVVGVQIEKHGRVHDVRARHVIMATGNAGNNPALLSEWEVDAENDPVNQDPVDLVYFMMRAQDLNLDGSGIVIMRDDAHAAMLQGGFGAVSNVAFGRAWFDDNRFHGAFAINSNVTNAFNAPVFFSGGALVLANSIVVTSQGYRFRAENDLNSGRGASRMMTLNAGPYWMITTNAIPQAGGENPTVVGGRSTHQWLEFARTEIAAGRYIVPAARPGLPPHDLRNEFRSATSLQDLANEIFGVGTPENAAFMATVNLYNTRATAALTNPEEWIDPLTQQANAGAHWPVIGRGKPAEFALPIVGADVTPRYYAIRIYPSGWDTWGGVVTDAYGAVINRAGTVIPGLWAVGGASNRDLFDQHYLGGTSVTIYPGMGHLAALMVMEQLAP